MSSSESSESEEEVIEVENGGSENSADASKESLDDVQTEKEPLQPQPSLGPDAQQQFLSF